MNTKLYTLFGKKNETIKASSLIKILSMKARIEQSLFTSLPKWYIFLLGFFDVQRILSTFNKSYKQFSLMNK